MAELGFRRTESPVRRWVSEGSTRPNPRASLTLALAHDPRGRPVRLRGAGGARG